MALQCGIVGLPNVGKSTMFNALTKAGVPAENYAFCTIDPNVGIVEVPDPRLGALAEIVKPQRLQFATVEFVDIAGLIAGASKGEGRGNQFLSHIRQTHAIVNVVRCFEDDMIEHVSNKVDPIADIETIAMELILADMQVIEKALQKQQKLAKSGDKEAVLLCRIFEKCSAHLDAGLPLRTLDLDTDELLTIQSYGFISAKPVLYVANVHEDGFTNNPHLERLLAYASERGEPVVAMCAAVEAEMADMDLNDKLEFLKEMGLEEPGLNRLIREAYRLLGLQTYFTAGVKEVRAWTIPVGATAPQAAGVIHTDFERGFIRAQTISFENFIQYKGEQGAKEAGKMRAEGKEYVVQDGDVMNFLFNV